jgi:hypothetical protein
LSLAERFLLSRNRQTTAGEAVHSLNESIRFILSCISLLLLPPEFRSSETYYKFWLSPSTLAFENVSDLHLDLEPNGAPIIMDLSRSDPETISNHATTWHWSFDCLDGEIAFRSTGYRQFTRRPPELASQQFFSQSERGGVSFSHVTPANPIA